MTTITISKSMPSMVSGSEDRGNTFILGRKAFFNSNSQPYTRNVDYSAVKNKVSSNVYAKPLVNQSGDLRAQKLRLIAAGSGSSRLKDLNDKVSYSETNGNNNLVNNVLTRVRGTGGGRPKYYKRS